MFSATILLMLGTAAQFVHCQEDPEFWRNSAKEDIRRSRSNDLLKNRNVAKNVILFVGDGMGVTTVTAARILKGQLKGNTGEEENLEMDQMPFTGLVKTYSVDRQTTDSASAATAYLSGKKSKYGTIGVDGRVQRYNCSSQQGKEVTTILDWAKAAGKSVGVVTTARITHASPAATYAHAADRNWEADSRQSNCGNPCPCKDIARQLIEDNPDIQVIMGGGRRFFIPNTEADISNPSESSRMKYQRADGRNLINEWIDDKDRRGHSNQYVYNKSGFDAVDGDNTDYLLGLFAYSHMDYNLERDDSGDGQPSIRAMTEKAIQILSRNPNGFFLFVEGARIDHGHHDGRAKRALYDTVAFDDAIHVAKVMTSEHDTLIAATADHSFSINVVGYSARGNPILGIANPISDMDWPTDNKPYTTIMYATGAGHRADRLNLTNEMADANDFRQDATIPMEEAAHGAEDVALYAQGPMSHLVVGTHEENYLPYLMSYAACIGDFSGSIGTCRNLYHRK